jgi:hypothetical protein
MGDVAALHGEPALTPDGLTAQGLTPQGPTSTGVPSVDAVLSEVEELDELPLDQHLGRFERAHEALRSALEAPADEQQADPAADESA